MGRSFLLPSRSPPIPQGRKILCTFVLASLLGAGAVASAGAGDSGTGRHDLLRAVLSQSGHKLVLTVRTGTPLALAKLERLPADRGGSRHLCFELRQAGRRGRRLLCLGGAGAHRRIGVELRNAAGEIVRKRTLAAHVKRPRPEKLALAIDPETAGLAAHRYRWRLLENRRGCNPRRCDETLPERGTRAFRLRPVRAVGCSGGRAGAVRNSPRDHDAIALSFDDGPGPYTEAFLDVLRKKHVHGTFFEIGQEVAGRAGVMRRILREGHEIGNHTTHHGFYPGYWDMAATNALIRSATHFEPCLFRPPGGAVNSAVVAAAGAAGMTTALWDVDPSDWSNPGAAAVYSRVVSAARPGSIVVMHDGGGNRSGTLAALPRIIETLRRRGYRFATVSELLGHRMLYRPYG